MKNNFRTSGPISIREMMDGNLKPMSPEGKNNLPIGTILEMNGYDNPRFVIVKNLGISEKFAGYGAKYVCVNLETLGMDQKAAYELKFISERKDNRIQTYITEEPCMDMDKVKSLHQEAIWQSDDKKQKREEAATKTQAAIERGIEFLKKNQPAWAKSAIVAYQEIDDCDLQSDYFNTKSGKLYILGWSKHNRDIFSEMRKHAHKLEKTKHLAVAPNTDRNGDPKTDSNKAWWYPSDVHREKYSMGAGYYLKDSHRYSTGWKIEKHSLKYSMDEIHLAAGEERCLA